MDNDFIESGNLGTYKPLLKYPKRNIKKAFEKAMPYDPTPFRLPVLTEDELEAVGSNTNFKYFVGLVPFATTEQSHIVTTMMTYLFGKYTKLARNIYFKTSKKKYQEDIPPEAVQFPENVRNSIVNVLVGLYQGNPNDWDGKLRQYFFSDNKPKRIVSFLRWYSISREHRDHFRAQLPKAKTQSNYTVDYPDNFDMETMVYQPDMPDTGYETPFKRAPMRWIPPEYASGEVKDRAATLMMNAAKKQNPSPSSSTSSRGSGSPVCSITNVESIMRTPIEILPSDDENEGSETTTRKLSSTEDK